MANINQPEVIRQIHREYLQVGAQVIRTNTFSANCYDLNCNKQTVNAIIKAGFEIAQDCVAGTDAVVACSIGPISENSETKDEELLEAYFSVIDQFIALGAKLFIFETFSHTEHIEKLVKYIISQDATIEIIASFSLNHQGYTKKGMSLKRIVEELSLLQGITAYGFNCGVGAGHLYNLLKTLDLQKHTILAMPNAGYPEKIYDRTLYQDNAEYFSDVMMDICHLGVKIIGGCCGTTPKHLQLMTQKLSQLGPITAHKQAVNPLKKHDQNSGTNLFYNKLDSNAFVIAVELDPPYGYDVSKLMEAAHLLKANGVDILTIADSPLGKVRLDSIMMSAKILREVGIDVMPHICCRDKNSIALKATISAAYVEGIRNYLLVTGDPLPDAIKAETKGVFHMNSVKLMSLVNEMNQEVPQGAAFVFGGALNPKATNIDRVIDRVLAKKEAGAKYLLTQPIYEQQDIDNLKKIRQATGIKILGGVLPLVSYRNARFINNEFPGMNIPETIIQSFKQEMTREEAEEVGINCSVDVCKAMKPFVDGFYFMTPFNRATMITKILKQL